MSRPESAHIRRSGRLLAFLTSLIVLMLATMHTPAFADNHAVVSGAGSTWSQVAVDAWRVDMRKNGVVINYSGTGSSDGRAQFRYGTVDYGISEIPFQAHPEDGSAPEISPRPFAYLPIVAGGTSFMYHVTVGGREITDLRLSGDTLTKIFTGVITDWSDPQITRDYGKALPRKAITPVVRSDGSGTSAQFSLYMATEHSTLWNAFCVKYAGGHPPCGLTSFYPQFPGSKAQSGSNGVANYVAASYGDGSITYVEYAYARNLDFPVVKVLNNGGYYVLPTASNVAVALTKATINSDLTQNLTGVYTNSDPRAYPLSSYSYMIVPTTTAAPFSVAKGRTLSTFINYFLCDGQAKADVLGYSPLPRNLVQAGFAQVRRIPGHVDPPSGDLSACGNPAVQGGKNALLAAAAYPTACDKAGSPLCGTAAAAIRTKPGTAGVSAGASAPKTAGGGSATSGSASGSGSGSGSGAAVSKPTASAPSIDPLTGHTAVTPASDSSTQTSATSIAQSQVVDVSASRSTHSGAVLHTLTAALLVGAVFVPPLFSVFLRRRSRK